MNIILPTGEACRPGKLLCIGRNYAAHVREMGDVPDLPSEPVVFLKPSTALVSDAGPVVLPHQSSDVHHELELVVVIGEDGKHIPEENAMSHVAGFALGIDFTARDIQAKAKANKGPWSIAKGFDTFAPLGLITPAEQIPDVQNLNLELKVNGETRQSGSTAHMIFPVPKLISFLSSVFTLERGDLIYTGTPEGVGPVQVGDELVATGTGLTTLNVTIRAATTCLSFD